MGKGVPLAIALVSTSNPQLLILDTLSKYSHDDDLQLAVNTIFAMGLVGAGTNMAGTKMLRQYYAKEPQDMLMVQGLVHLGTIGLKPFFCDRGIMHKPGTAASLVTLTAFPNAKTSEYIEWLEINLIWPLLDGSITS